jgi:hypothetical protein
MAKTLRAALDQPALPQLRLACYGRLQLDSDQLGQALDEAPPQGSREAQAAYTRLRRTGRLLDRIGWTDSDESRQVTLDSAACIELAATVLRDVLGMERSVRVTALAEGAAAQADRALAREQAVHEALKTLQSATAEIDSSSAQAGTQRAA